MSVGFPTLGGTGRTQPPRVDRRPPAADAATRASGPAAGHDVPAADAGEMPPEVRAEVREAARCAERLQQQGRQVRFERDPHGGGIRAEVRDLDGNVLRAMPLAEIFDVARGAEVD